MTILSFNEHKRAVVNGRLAGHVTPDEGHRRNELVATMAHELRNPLASILNAVQVVRLCSADSSAVDESLELVERQALYMKTVIDFLMDSYHGVQVEHSLHKEVIDLSTVLQRAAESAAALVSAHQHRLTVSVPSESLWVVADPWRLEEILMNLIANAAKYTSRGGHIELTAARECDDIVVRVTDNGVGIGPEELPHVFDRFWRSPRAAEHSAGGLGIGLALVRQLVEMHEGSVHAFSDGFGRGSEFVVRLPECHLP
jgi:signal transduction histidine kinase